MKDAKLLIWLSQLGLSVAAPLGGFILLAVWLKKHFAWGDWVIVVGVLLGIICAVEGFLSTLKAADMIGKKKNEKPPISFNEHE